MMITPLLIHLDTVYHWLCRQRKNYPAPAEAWSYRWHRTTERQGQQAEIAQGTLRLGPMSIITPMDGEPLHLRSARDALVLKAVTLALDALLALSPRCMRVKGHGGLKAAVREPQQNLGGYEYVVRTDVKGFYESIDQPTLLAQLAKRVHDPGLLDLLRQAAERGMERGGLWRDIRTGISRDCPLSPLLGALYLNRLAAKNLYYVRYMDDILALNLNDLPLWPIDCA